MIILRQLRWSNVFSYGDNNELSLDEVGLTQILGTNGVGKSSIAIILEEVLYNKNSKGVKKVDIPNREGLDSYNMGLDFSVDDDEYVIELERKKVLKLKLSKNGEDISSHTATNTFKTIEGILGLDFKTFSQLLNQNTNSSLQFLTATDTTRKRFLIELLTLDKYVEYFEIFKALVKEYNSKVVAVQSKIDTLESWLSKNNLKGMIVLPKLNLDINSEKDEKALGTLSAEFKNILETNRKISTNNLYKQQLAGIDMALVANVSGEVQSVDDLNVRMGTLRSEYNTDLSMKSKYGNMTQECPTCGQSVDLSFEEEQVVILDASLVANRIARDDLANTIHQITTQNKLIKLKEKTEKEFESLYTAIDNEIPGVLLEASDIKLQIAELETSVKKKRDKIEFIMQENERIERNNTRISVIQEQKSEFEEQLNTVLEELSTLSDTYSNLEVLKKAFSTNGLLAYKIEYLVKELETIVNEYLSELSDGRFTLEFAVTNDKLNVVITDNGKQVDILSLSSGELARVNTSTLLAIRRLMNSISKSQINVLFLDEVIGVLDDAGRERLVDVLVREDKLNTFIVSHEWSHPLLAKLRIMKENNISKLIKD